MLNKLIQKKNIILIACAVILLTLWILTLIFGNGEDKTLVLVLTLILPFVVYGFVRLMYKMMNVCGSPKTMRIFFGFFLIMGTYCIFMMLVEYINGFPNGLSPTLGAFPGLIVATLVQAKKNSEMGNEE